MTDGSNRWGSVEDPVRVCSESDLVDDRAIRVAIEGTAIAVAKVDGGVFAIADTCSHADYSLSAGDVDPLECALECPKHGSLFSLRTGEALTLPATIPVATYPVEVRDGEVFVTMRSGDPDGSETTK